MSDWHITINDAEFMDIFQDDTKEFEGGERDKFILLSVSATNNAKEGVVFLPTEGEKDDIHCKVLYDLLHLHLFFQEISMNKVLEPATSTDGIVAVTIPIELVEDKKPMILQFFDTDTTISINLK